MTLEQISALLRQVTDEVQKLEKESKTEIKDTDDDQQFAALARKYPFEVHVLTYKSDIVRKYYIATLLSLVSNVKDHEVEKKQRLYIGRIIASYDMHITMKPYIAQSLKVDQKYLCDLSDTFDPETSFCFAVDLIALYMLGAESVGKKDFEAVSDVLQLLGMNREVAAKAMKVSKSIVEQDFTQLLEQIEPGEDRDYDCFLGYFPENEYTSITADFANINDLTGNALIVNGVLENCSEYIELDGSAAEEITFYHCNFDNIRGIRGKKKGVTFDNCKFENNCFAIRERQNGWRTYIECEKNYVFIQGNNMTFRNTVFKNIRASKAVLDISNGEIKNGEFLDCKGVEILDSYLFEINTGNIINSLFKNCSVESRAENKRDTNGGLLLLTKCALKESCFEKCNSIGKSGYGRFARFSMQIVKAVNSKIEKCKFSECRCSSDSSSDKFDSNYILGLKKSTERSNEFDSCFSYQSEYGRCSGEHIVADIE